MITAKQIIKEVSDAHGCTVTEMRSRNQCYPIARARYEAMYRIRKETRVGRHSLTWIGKQFGRHHATVLYGIEQHKASQANQGAE